MGYIIGPRLASINFAGAALAWFVFIPLVLFLNPDLASDLSQGGETPSVFDLSYTVWYNVATSCPALLRRQSWSSATPDAPRGPR